MLDYQFKKENTYVLPQSVYRQALYAVKDLTRLKRKLFYLREEARSIKSLDPSETLVSGGTVSDLTGNIATEINLTETRIAAIEKAFNKLPEKYRTGVREKLVHDVPYDESAHCINTWKKWQQILIYHVACELNIL
ncbi:MAG: hypothetical protein K5653_00440 [Clostridiales bacterium]|jgi:DNA-directed RNA polymerase specialized sigma24 family protein|nr:hypothetical protein [Clostridiales bacterium]